MTENQEVLQILGSFSDIITIKTFIKTVIIYFLVIWVAIFIWVIRDITNRTDSILLQFFSILIILI
jgi:hypothetical protein